MSRGERGKSDKVEIKARASLPICSWKYKVSYMHWLFVGKGEKWSPPESGFKIPYQNASTNAGHLKSTYSSPLTEEKSWETSSEHTANFWTYEIVEIYLPTGLFFFVNVSLHFFFFEIWIICFVNGCCKDIKRVKVSLKQIFVLLLS